MTAPLNPKSFESHFWFGNNAFFVCLDAFTTGNPLFFTILLEISIGRDLGDLKGLSRALFMGSHFQFYQNKRLS